MPRLKIRHETLYRYEKPVRFGAHRLMLRPRDSHAIRLFDARLELYPGGATRWVYDALGNCVCRLEPQGEADTLRIVSTLVLDRFPAPLAPLDIDDPHTATPIVYSRPDRAVLEPFIAPATDCDPVLLKWLRGRMPVADEPALDFLQRLTRSIRAEFVYRERNEEGVRSPDQTVRLGEGACRDLAWLMVEGLRRLGFAARFVSGYLHSPGADGAAMRGAGATHAWCEAFLPSLGWVEFDPTNGLAESPNLIAVAAARTPLEAAPVSGSIIGDPGRCELFVSVDVSSEGPLEEAA